MNKKAFLDTEILMSSGFILLLLFAWSATIIGYVISKRMDAPPFPLWQIGLVLLGEAVASYFFASR